jgi:1,4-dihydroxy-2-naphthoate octaprenyltransferase
MKIKHWIAAARLRTLPLAFSSIILGTCLAASKGSFDVLVFVLSLLTTLCYQVLSNYANDYGDGVKGTDDNRKGEQRAVAAGIISPKQMKNAVILFSILSFVFGTWLSIVATFKMDLWVTILFIVLGILAIVAAITYTVGAKAYGYKGWGDVFVLLFFGHVGVVGSYFLQYNQISWDIFLPATAVGFLAMGVLNLNNMRDIETDKEHGKRTIPVLIGLQKAKFYHGALIILALDLAYIYNKINPISLWQNLFFVTIPMLIAGLFRVRKSFTPEDFEPQLKILAITTLLFSITLGIGQIL